MIDESVKQDAKSIFETTYYKAQLYDLSMSKEMGVLGNPWLPHCHYWPFPPWGPRPPFVQNSGFLDGSVHLANRQPNKSDRGIRYYDDEGWWALAWIAAYDVTEDQEYLSQAESIFDDMYQVFGKTNCSTNSGGTGGIWWDKNHTYVNAIANELFLDVAAHLANRVESKAETYLSIAKQQLAWFLGSGMINSQNTINDGLNQTNCQNNEGTVWSYNQGVILGGLSELSRATNDPSYIQQAQTIADAAIANLSTNGILHDVCEPNCGADGSQFKGVFTRNLQILQKASPQTRYANFLQDNANSIWSKDRNPQNELSVVWSGPFVTPANASTQSSAMDTLVAALAGDYGNVPYPWHPGPDFSR